MAEAQRGKIKQQEGASEAARDGTDTVHEWNHGFFPHTLLLVLP